MFPGLIYQQKMGNKSLADCQKIFLDTGIILDAIRPGNDGRKKLILDLLKYLSTTKTSTHNKTRRFYISALTLSEISNLGAAKGFVQRIADLLDVSNTEFVNFDRKMGLWVSENWSELLKKKSLNRIAKDNGLILSDAGITREWVNRDVLILTTAHFANVDVVFTTEKKDNPDLKTFVSIAVEMGLFVVPTYPEYFLSTQREEFFPAFSDLAKNQSFELKGRVKHLSKVITEAIPE